MEWLNADQYLELFNEVNGQCNGWRWFSLGLVAQG